MFLVYSCEANLIWKLDLRQPGTKCPTDLAGVALPAAFLRWSIPPEEPVLATQLLALFVGGVALADRNLRHAGHVPNFELSVSLGLRLIYVIFNFLVSVRIINHNF